MKSFLTIFFCAALSLFMLPACGPSKTPETAAQPLVTSNAEAPSEASKLPFPYVTKTLGNGMKIITLEDHSTPVVSVQLWYHVGAKDERIERRGFAHMFEHMMFQGTPNIGAAEHQTLIQSTGGNANAYTSFDQTVYTQTVPSNQLELVLWLESERMTFLKIDEEGFRKERNVVAEEYHKTATQPYGTVLDKLLPELFPDGLYSWSPIGVMEELEASKVSELQKFWESYYTPDNATLVIVGDIQSDEALAQAEKYFGWIPSYGPKPEPSLKRAVAESAPRKIVIKEKSGPAPLVGLSYRTVASGDPDEIPLDLLGEILGGGDSSRLYRKLVAEDGDAMAAMAGTITFEDDGLLLAGALLSPIGGDQDKVLASLRGEIRRLRDEGPSERELTKARNQALRSAVTTQLQVNSKAELLGTASVLYKDVALSNSQFEKIRSVSVADIQRVAKIYLDEQKEVEVRIEPNKLGFLGKMLPDVEEEPSASEKSETKAQTSDEASKTKTKQTWGKPGLTRPAWFPDTPPIAAPLDVDWQQENLSKTLPNGLRVVVIPNDEVPFVTFKLGLRSGAFTDPPDAFGTASMTMQMLTRGTDSKDEETLSELLEFNAISLGGAVSMDTGSISASAVTDQVEQAASLFAEVIQSPSFPEDQRELLFKQYRTGRAIQEKSPDFMANRELSQRLYGDHPYAREVEPSLEQLDAITGEKMKAWWSANATPKNAVLYIAGDLSPEEAYALAEKHLGSWSGDAPAIPSIPPTPPQIDATHIYLVDHEAKQSQIRIALHGITRDHESYFATRVFNQIYGGGSLKSRLNQSIRGDKGMSYGAYGGFSARRFAGTFRVQTFSQNKSVPEVISTIIEETERMRTTSPSAEETEQAQRFLSGGFVLGRETPQAIAQDQWLIDAFGLSSDYFQKYLSGINATTPEDIQRSAAALIDTKKMIIVVVGPAKELKAELEKIAPVTVIKSAP